MKPRPYPLRGIVLSAAGIAPFVWLIGLVLKDRFLPLNLFYYCPPIVALVAGLIGFFALRRSRPKASWVILAVTLLALGKILAIDFEYNSPTESATEEIRLIQWNTSGGRFGIEPVVEGLQSLDPDLVLLSEAPSDKDILELADKIFPNGHWFRTNGMALMSRFPIQVLERLELPDGRGWAATVTTDQGAIDFLAVDLRANLLVAREPDLEFLTDWIEGRSTGKPLIVAGDFNTPRDSTHFEGFRKTLAHGYETAGHSWPYSWPFPLPMIQTDHVWHSKGLVPLDHRYEYRFGSDHLPQMFSFALGEENRVLTETSNRD